MKHIHHPIRLAIAAIGYSAKSSILGTTLAVTAFFAGSMAAHAGAPTSAGDIPNPMARAGAQKQADPIRLLAKLKNPNSITAQEYLDSLENSGLSRKKSYQLVPGLQILEPKVGINKVTDHASLRIAAKELMATGLYEYVEPDHLVYVQQLPDDARFTDGTLWGLRNNGQNGGRIGIDVNAVPAWDITTGTSDVVVAVIDTGVRYTHQDLSANMWINEDEIPGNGIDDDNNGYVDDKHGINAITGSGDPMDDHNHGTHCSGTIAATAFGGGGHVGVAYNVRIMALKFLSAGGSGDTSGAISCVEYAVANGADIMSNSWGGGPSSQALLDAIQAANNANISFIAAAGNEASDTDESDHFPSNYDVENVISVAAIDRAGNLASFSNFGDITVDLGAPGVDIYSTTASSDTSYDTYSGTSMACPHVSGVAALVLARHPGISVAELRARLLIPTTPISSLTGKTVTGGMVNALESLNIEEDGDLELSVEVVGLLEADTTNTMRIRVTDLLPVSGATVTGNFPNQIATSFLDDGNFPDQVANDGNYTARIDVPLPAGPITFAVDATAPGKNPASKDFILTSVSVPLNDDFEDRIVLAGGTSSTTGSNIFSSIQANEQRTPFGAGTKSVWWSWAAQNSGSTTINTFGSNFDTTLAIYTGSDIANLSLVASNDDNTGLQSSVTFSAIEGQVYAIQVNGYADKEGSIVLSYPDPGFGSSVPQILRQPIGKSLLVGAPLKLSVSATGTPPLQFQWFQDSRPIDGAIDPIFEIANVEVDDQAFYRVEITNDFGTVVSEPVFVSVNLTGARPANDDFANAQPLSGASGSITGTNILATGENNEPIHAGTAAPLQSVWYNWQAPSAGVITINTFGTDFDTTLAIYTGEDVSMLTRIASNDDTNNDGTNGRQSMVSVTVAAGTHYRIAVDGFGSEEGTISLIYDFTPASDAAPANDMFSDRISLNAISALSAGTNVQATAEAEEPDHAEASSPIESVWWSWTASSHGIVTFSTADSNFDTTLAAYTGSTIPSLTLVAFDDDSGPGSTSTMSFEVTPGETYAISVDGYAGSKGSISLSVSFVETEGREPNDLFASRTAINAPNAVVNGSNMRAHAETGEPNHAGFSTPIQSVWWSWTAPSAGLVNFNTLGSDFDTMIAVYTGTSLNTLVEVSSNDDASASTKTSSTTFETTAGQTYVVAVDSFGNATGSIQLETRFTPDTVIPPSTDASLASLLIDSQTLSPSFSPSTRTYTVALPYEVSSIRVTPATTDENATVKVNGAEVASGSSTAPLSMVVGSNTISIVVTAESGATKTYTITAARARPASATVAKLIDISLSAGNLTPTFSSNVTSYTANVGNSVSSLTVTPTATDDQAVIKVNGTRVTSGAASLPVELKGGLNEVSIIVTAQNGNNRTYSIAITRAASSNAKLAKLKLKGETITPEFKPRKLNYRASVSKATKTARIVLAPADESADVTINGKPWDKESQTHNVRLVEDKTVIRIRVKAEDGTVLSYRITVRKS
jgi:subtilisin family serine protease